jgi:hypothetical protein
VKLRGEVICVYNRRPANEPKGQMEAESFAPECRFDFVTAGALTV